MSAKISIALRLPDLFNSFSQVPAATHPRNAEVSTLGYLRRLCYLMASCSFNKTDKDIMWKFKVSKMLPKQTCGRGVRSPAKGSGWHSAERKDQQSGWNATPGPHCTLLLNMPTTLGMLCCYVTSKGFTHFTNKSELDFSIHLAKPMRGFSEFPNKKYLVPHLE